LNLCGLPVISVGYGSVLDYLTPKNAHLVSYKGEVKLFKQNPWHHGNISEPDVDNMCNKLRYVIEHIDEEKKKALKNSIKIRQEFSWKRIADKIFEELVNLSWN